MTNTTCDQCHHDFGRIDFVNLTRQFCSADCANNYFRSEGFSTRVTAPERTIPPIDPSLAAELTKKHGITLSGPHTLHGKPFLKLTRGTRFTYVPTDFSTKELEQGEFNRWLTQAIVNLNELSDGE